MSEEKMADEVWFDKIGSFGWFVRYEHTVIRQLPSGDVVVMPDEVDGFKPPPGQYEQEHVRRVTGCAATDLG